MVAGIDLRFSMIGGPPFDEKLCDCVMWLFGPYAEGIIGIGAGSVGGGPGFGALPPFDNPLCPLPPLPFALFDTRRYC